MRNWYPDIYEKHFGRKLTAEESFTVRKQTLDAKLNEHYRPRTGYGEWAWNVPVGH